MRSGFVESLSLILSDKFEVSDRDCKALSDILLSRGISESIFETGMIQLISIMVYKDLRFPISLEYLKEVWAESHITFNFVSMLSDMVRTGLISLRKVKEGVFISSDNITKSVREPNGAEIYLVLYGSKDFNFIFDEFSSKLSMSKKTLNSVEYMNESVSMKKLPSKVRGFIDKLGKLMDLVHMTVDVESVDLDTSIDSFKISVIINRTSKYDEKALNKVARKHIKGKALNDFEIFMDSMDSVYLGLNIKYSMDAGSIRSLAESIYTCFEELEVVKD